jgi:hypothetical protein
VDEEGASEPASAHGDRDLEALREAEESAHEAVHRALQAKEAASVRVSRKYGDAANPWATVADVAAGITNPAATGAAVIAAQTPIQVQGPGPDYTPILIGGSAVLLLALYIKRGE